MQDAPTVIDPQPTLNLALQKRLLIVVRIAFVVFSFAAILFFILGLPDTYQTRLHLSSGKLELITQLGLTPEIYAALYTVPIVLLAIIYVSTALFIAWRKNNDWLVLLLAFALIGQGVYAFEPLNDLAGFHTGWYFPVYFLASLIEASIVVACYLFPSGRFVPRWSWMLGLIWLVWLLSGAFIPGFVLNPHLDEGMLISSLVIFYGSGVLAQIYRYRRQSDPVQRQQTKWIVFGVALAIGVGVGVQIADFLLLSQSSTVQIITNLGLSILSALGQSILPICIAVAIMRYRLFDIDFLINRGLVYAALTVLLAIVFGLILVLVAQITNQATLALIIAAGAAGLLFRPVRRQVQFFVDRRFYNIRIDYEKQPLYGRSGQKAPLREIPKTEFGDYKDLQLIGKGGMALVYKAQHPTLHQPVAIKILANHFSGDPDLQKRFEHEATFVSGLEHDNILRIYDHGVSSGIYYIVMEYIDGSDLGQYLRKQGRLPLERALPIFQQIASALDYAHQKGLVHRDIKPANIMLDRPDTPASRAVLTDFGIAKLITAVTRLTTANLLGTLDYIAPEQIQDSADVDGRADIYAFGVMVYQLLTGDVPFKYSNPGALVIAHMTQPPPDPCVVIPELPKSASMAIRRALAKQPADRYQTSAEFIAALG